ncbi:hypothetical protein BBH88_13895 [Planococcus antarcticus DSM 14505]|uniref:Uncharacterized protein n=1 Tax=Planococcus antarcticus DSM 14505 TaxID=1185653 RepID=A0ABM6D7Y9_9BACL|nr:hypothetical protein BBH88_13895 [Planococcus antarcticus DSM 14505]
MLCLARGRGGARAFLAIECYYMFCVFKQKIWSKMAATLSAEGDPAGSIAAEELLATGNRDVLLHQLNDPLPKDPKA